MKLTIYATLLASIAAPALAANNSPIHYYAADDAPYEDAMVNHSYLILGVANNMLEKQNIDLDDTSYDTKAITKIDDAIAFKLGLGYELPTHPSIATELTANYQTEADITLTAGTEKITSGIKSISLIYDVKWDISTALNQDWFIHPYLGLGAGYSWNKLSDLSDGDNSINFKDQNSSFAWHAVAGAKYFINNNIALDLSYSYNDYGKAEGSVDGSTVSYDYKFEQVALAMNIHF